MFLVDFRRHLQRINGDQLVSLIIPFIRHSLFRGFSAILSLVIFTIILNQFSESYSAKIFSFLFIFGFLISSTRLASQIYANIEGSRRLSHRLSRALTGLFTQQALCLLILPVVFIYLITLTENVYCSAFVTIVFFFSSWDLDLVRSSLGKTNIFPVLFSIGSVCAVLFLMTYPTRSLNVGIIAGAIQWLPVSIANFKLAKYLNRRNLALGLSQIQKSFGLLILSLFDGIVINTPFFGFVFLTVEQSIELSVIIRIFVSALPFVPLILHLANTPNFATVASKYNTSTELLVMAFIFFSGLIVGFTFLIFLYFTSEIASLSYYFCGFLALLIGYSFYLSHARFSSREHRKGTPLIVFTSFVIIVFQVILAVVLPSLNGFAIFYLVLSQVLCFFSVGIFLRTRQ